jgi:hypothetical protein
MVANISEEMHGVTPPKAAIYTQTHTHTHTQTNKKHRISTYFNLEMFCENVDEFMGVYKVKFTGLKSHLPCSYCS